MKFRRGYTNTPDGQLHWRMAAPETADQPDLYCFHPAPFSGLAFTGVMPHLATGRRVIAPDYPGYGGSDSIRASATIEAYATSMARVIDDLSNNKTIDILGFHTGCLVAAELSLIRPNGVRKAVLIDVPTFDDERRSEFLKSLTPLLPSADIVCLEAAWASGFVKRLESQPAERAFEMFVEQLRPGEKMNDAFVAAFSYPWAERLPLVEVETRIIATRSPLLGASRAAANVMKAATLIERLDIKRAVLDEAAKQTAVETLTFLDAD